MSGWEFWAVAAVAAVMTGMGKGGPDMAELEDRMVEPLEKPWKGEFPS